MRATGATAVNSEWRLSLLEKRLTFPGKTTKVNRSLTKEWVKV